MAIAPNPATLVLSLVGVPTRMIKFAKIIATGVTIASVWTGFLVSPATALPIAPQKQNLGQQLFQNIQQCLREQVPNPLQVTLEELQAISMQCVFEVVLLAPDGSLRPDASDRMMALVETTGVTIPQPTSQGEASVELRSLPNSRVFGLPVTVGGESQQFLFDTGASNSIVSDRIARELGLEGTPIPKQLLTYFAVGDNCEDLDATLHSLPTLAVENASVEGMTGMGLPASAIPSNLSGVLGVDFWSGFDVKLDPQAKRVELLARSPLTSEAIPLEGKMGIMATQVQINDRDPVTLGLDTGADLMVISDRLARQLSLDLDNAREREILGFCGTQMGQQVTLDRVRIQQHELTNLEAVIIDAQILDLVGVDGLVGQNFLTRYRQHWRFGELNPLGFPDRGSLELEPIQ